jgi:acyl-CoA thioesterase-1
MLTALLLAIAIQADPATYLADVCQELTKDWPKNRMVEIVCHGHSVPAGYAVTPVVDSMSAYPHLLHEALAKRFPHAVINVTVTAIGGETSIGGERRFARDVLSRHPDVVTIDYGLNDRAEKPEAVRAAWLSMIAQAKAQGIKVLLLTPTWDIGANMKDPRDPLIRQAEAIRRLAKEEGVGLVDSFAAFQRSADSGTPLPSLMAQINHPNRAGHELVLGELLRWFPGKQAGSLRY